MILLLDIGSSKTASCILEWKPEHKKYEIHQLQQQKTFGFETGVMVDQEALVYGLNQIIESYQKNWGPCKKTMISFSGSHLKSHLLNTNVIIEGETIVLKDIEKALEFYPNFPNDQEVIQVIPLAYWVDQQTKVLLRVK
jgi:cell division ATPase FtsA